MRDRKVTQKGGGGPCPSKGGDVGELFRARVSTELHPKILPTISTRLVTNIGVVAHPKRNAFVRSVTTKLPVIRRRNRSDQARWHRHLEVNCHIQPRSHHHIESQEAHDAQRRDGLQEVLGACRAARPRSRVGGSAGKDVHKMVSLSLMVLIIHSAPERIDTLTSVLALPIQAQHQARVATDPTYAVTGVRSLRWSQAGAAHGDHGRYHPRSLLHESAHACTEG